MDKKSIRNGIVLLLFLISSLGCAQERSQYSEQYLIPPGYVGIVRLYHNVPTAKPLEMKNGTSIVHVPECGYVLTSTKGDLGWVTYSFYYTTQDGLHELSVETDGTVPSIWPQTNESFFVGTLDQYNRFGNSGRVGRITNPDQRGTGESMQYSDMSKIGPGSKLVGADLTASKGRGADLRRVDLTDATLNSVDLSDADLSGARLRRTDFLGAYLKRANLESADMRGAQLEAADLRGARLRGANLRGAQYDRNTNWPAGFDPVKAGAKKTCEQPGVRPFREMVRP